MNAELIKALREDAEWAHANEWETPITLGDHLDAAADALEAADNRVKELKAAQRWIPCEETLPTERGHYLAVVNRTAPEDLGGNGIRVKIMRWLGDDWRYPYHIPAWINGAVTDTVTHWKKLPDPPQKGE